VITGWRPLGDSGKLEAVAVDLIRDHVKNGSCDNGSHVAESRAPFGLTVWGLDGHRSYAYPAGGRYAPINNVVLPSVPK
jgi:hypothetical protein